MKRSLLAAQCDRQDVKRMKMNSLLGKILLALLATTLLALLLVSLIQRYSLQQGFRHFLQQQEEVQLSYLVPELQDWYRQKGSWEQLRGETRRWLSLLAKTRPEGISPPEDALLHEDDHQREDDLTSGNILLRQSKSGRLQGPGPADELRRLWRRIYLLDAERRWVSGAPGGNLVGDSIGTPDAVNEQAIEVNGAAVGWVGFIPAIQPAAPEARRFILFQHRTLLLSAGIALLAAVLVGFLLARHLSRPVVALRDSVQSLTAGDFSIRTAVRGDDEIASLARHINRLAETLQANESARRRWTADLAHELRTPITILQAEIEAARDGVRPNLGTTLDSLQEEVIHLSGLVNDLQVLALADAGALNMQLAEVDLVLLLRQVVEALQERIRQAGLRVDIMAPDSLLLQADAQRLRQLLLNLLENSCRYTHAGGQVQIVLQSSPVGAELQIADSEPGLDPAQREQLFERFYRAENSRGRASGGSGLGLAICREIVLAHGGRIEAQASDLGGLAINITLPRAI